MPSGEVQCPECGTVYTDWYRPPINLSLDDFDEEYLHQASSATCPDCGATVGIGSLVTRFDGDGMVMELPEDPDGDRIED